MLYLQISFFIVFIGLSYDTYGMILEAEPSDAKSSLLRPLEFSSEDPPEIITFFKALK